MITTSYRSAAGLNAKWLSFAATLSRVQLLHSSLSCFISTLLLTLFAQPHILGYFVFLGWTEGPWGEILSIHRICDLELSFSLCQAFVFTLFYVKTEYPSLLFCIPICCFLSSHSTNPLPEMPIFAVCVCVCVCVRACVRACVRVCVCVCMCVRA